MTPEQKAVQLKQSFGEEARQVAIEIREHIPETKVGYWNNVIALLDPFVVFPVHFLQLAYRASVDFDNSPQEAYVHTEDGNNRYEILIPENIESGHFSLSTKFCITESGTISISISKEDLKGSSFEFIFFLILWLYTTNIFYPNRPKEHSDFFVAQFCVSYLYKKGESVEQIKKNLSDSFSERISDPLNLESQLRIEQFNKFLTTL